MKKVQFSYIKFYTILNNKRFTTFQKANIPNRFSKESPAIFKLGQNMKLDLSFRSKDLFGENIGFLF